MPGRQPHDALHELHAKLCRELAQTEQSAAVHCEREARRYGDHPPAERLRAISRHAVGMRAELAPLFAPRQALGERIGRGIGEALSLLRQVVIDRVVDAQRSYRATLLGVRHGVDVARVLQEVLTRTHDATGVQLCAKLIAERVALIEAGERALTWFARRPDLAVRTATSLQAAQARALRTAARDAIAGR